MNSFPKIHFKNKIFLCMLFVSYITILILSTLIYIVFQRDTREKIVTTYILSIEQVSDKLSYIYSDMRNIANSLSTNELLLDNLITFQQGTDSLQQLSVRQNIQNMLPQRANNYAVAFDSLICTTEGEIFSSGAQDFFYDFQSEDFLKQDWFHETRYNPDNLGWLDSGQIHPHPNNTSYFYIVRSLADHYNGKKLGILNIGFNERFIRHEITNILGIPYVSYIINNDNDIISSNQPELIGQTLDSGITTMLLQSNKNTFRAQKDENLFLRSAISGTPWHILINIPSKSLQIDMSQLLLNITFVAFLGFMLSGLLAYVLSESIIRPINILINKVRQIDAGNLKVEINEVGQDEIGILSNTIQHMSERLDTMMDCLLKKDRQKNEAEIKFLRAQINPHFLHNTLKTLPYLVQHGRDEEMSSIILSLTHILKESMVSHAAMIPLSKELELLRNYLYIMQVRYNYCFDFSINVPDDFTDILIPRLTLQPLFENAIFHTVDHADSSPLYIQLQIKHYEQDIKEAHLQIIDNGCGLSPDRLIFINQIADNPDTDSEQRQNIGIPNVVRRLKYYYQNATIHYESKLGEGTCVHLIIPIIREEPINENSTS